MPNINGLIKTYQNLLISGAILLFCVIGLVAAVIPAAEKIQTQFTQTQQLADQTKSLQTKLNALSALDEATLRQQLATVISAVPTDESMPTVFSTIDGIAAQSGVTVTAESIAGNSTLATASAVKLSPEEKQLGTRTVSFSVTINGTLDAIRNFIALAPQVRRLMSIRTFAISFPQDARPISIELEMSAFYQPSPTSLGTTETNLATLTDSEQKTIDQVSKLPVATGGDVALPPPLIGQLKPNPFAP